MKKILFLFVLVSLSFTSVARSNRELVEQNSTLDVADYCYNGVINNYSIKGQFYSPTIDRQSSLYLTNGSRNLSVGIGGSVAFDKVEIREILGLDVISQSPLRSFYKESLSGDFMDINIPELSYDGIYALLFFRNEKVIGICYLADRGKLMGNLWYIYNTSKNEASIISYYDEYFPTHLTLPETINLFNGGMEGTFRVSKIFDGALSCSKLESIVIPKTITYVGPDAFSGCTMLSDITIADCDKALNFSSTLSSSGVEIPAFVDCPIQKLYMGRDLYSATFKNQTKLKSVVISDSVTDLSSSIFSNCSSLTDLTIGQSVSSIREDAFHGCSSLENIDLPNGLTKIGQRAFEGCKSLKSLILPETLRELGTNSNGPANPNYIFSGCYALEDMICLYPKAVGKPIVEKNTTIYTLDPQEYGWGQPLGSLTQTEFEYSGELPILKFLPHYKSNISTFYNIEYDAEFAKGADCIDVGYYNAACEISFTYKNGAFSEKRRFTFRINPASLTIRAQSCTRVYGKPNPPIELIYEGFMNNETESVLTRSPIVSIAASEESNVGEYPITVNGAEAQNYSISYEPGVLTITQADQTIEWAQDFSNIKIDDEVDLTAIASSRLAIEYTSSNPDVAIIENGKAKFLAEGATTITAIQRGDDNYNEALPVEKEITVSPIYVETISLNITEESMEVGMTLQLEAVISPVNATTKELRWESSNPEIASISENGLVSALEVGTTTITAFATDGSDVSASCIINVSLSNGINTINEDGLKMTIEGNQIILDATDDNYKIDIFNISGKLVYQGNDRIISLPSGIYIMSVPGRTYKIIL